MSGYRLLISGGGTGGHVFPAIAIADAIKELHPDCEIQFAGTRSRMEWIAVPKAGYPIKEIWISGIHRRFTLKNLLVPLKLFVSLLQSRRIIKAFRPDAVICTGGYVSGPIGWTAARMGIPLFLQEQNSFPGLTTRKLAPKSTLIFTAFEEARKYLPVSKVELCGNPTRKVLHYNTREKSLKYFNFSAERKTILILGGSGGAKKLNNAVAANLSRLHDGLGLQIIWQSGSRYLDTINEVINPDKYNRLRLYSFVDDINHAYSAADLVISRAGASICSELLVTGKPSVLVPSPNVAGDHQAKNAQSMVAGGASVMVRDNKLSEELVSTLENLLSKPDRLHQMRAACGEMAKPDAAKTIASEIIRIINQTKEAEV